MDNESLIAENRLLKSERDALAEECQRLRRALGQATGNGYVSDPGKGLHLEKPRYDVTNPPTSRLDACWKDWLRRH